MAPEAVGVRGIGALVEAVRRDMEPEPYLIVRRSANGDLASEGTRACLLGAPLDVAGTLEGVWGRWQWDGQTLLAEQDRFGFYPLYYFQSPNAWGISPSIYTLIERGAPRDLDDEALSVFLRLGYFIGTDTPFKALHALPAGARLHADGTALVVEDRPETVRPRPVTGLSRDAAIEAFAELVQLSVNRIGERLGSHPVHQLSGGKDSRHILLALRAAGRLPAACVTVDLAPPLVTNDLSVARELCARCGVAHVALPPPASVLRAEVEKNVRTHLCAREHAWIVPLQAWMRRQGPTDVFDGIVGDVHAQNTILTRHKLDQVAAGRFEELAGGLMWQESIVQLVVPEEERRRWPREAAVARVASEIARHSNTPNPVTQFVFFNRTRRAISVGPWGLLAGRWRRWAPFLDHAVYDLMSGLPASFFLEKNFHYLALARRYPETADIPFARKAFSQVSARGRWLRHSAELLPLVLGSGGRRRLRRASIGLRMGLSLAGARRQITAAHVSNRTIWLLQLQALVEGPAAQAASTILGA